MDLAQKKIIMVDDAVVFQLSIRERLKHYYEVYAASSAEQLFEVLLKVVPDLILLDINMPEVDGFEVIKQLKNNPIHRNIPVIMLTGKTDKKSAVMGMSLGAIDYITKPITTEALLDSMDRVLYPSKYAAIKPIILAIDDSPSILSSVKHALSDEYEVYTLPRPEAIKEVLKKVAPDLFILDVQMPVLSGYELIPLIRSVSGHEDTPIVFLTTEAISDNIFAAISSGAKDFIVKPVNERVLREKMAIHLADFQMRRRIRDLK